MPMIPEHESSVFQRICVDDIVQRPQARTAIRVIGLKHLAQSIAALGVLQPLLVRVENGKLVLIDGARRLAASRKAGLKTVPVVITDTVESPAVIPQLQLIANCQREDLLPLEKANAVYEMMRLSGWPASVAATNLGMSEATISRLLALRELPEAIRAQVDSGSLPASTAYELTALTDVAAQGDLAERVVSGELTREAVINQIKSARRHASILPSNARKVKAVLNGNRSITVAADDLTLESFIGALEELLARARKARPKAVSLDAFIKTLRNQAKPVEPKAVADAR